MMKSKKKAGYVFFMKIIFPTILAIGLFIFTFFAVLVPTFEKNSLDHKREMIRKLTDSAWSILDRYAQEEQKGTMTRAQAKKQAIAEIRHLRYGPERKDYFWINDLEPKMIMHPYRPELEGKNLSDYKDRQGKKLFVAFVDTVKQNNQGYVDYTWQWKDDPDKDVPKLSYVKGFEPWGWIIGTGIYIEDVKLEIARLTRKLVVISLVIAGVIFMLLVFITQQSFRIERQRLHAEADLHQSREKYRTLVEASTEGTIMTLGGKCVFSNQTMQDMLGYTKDEFADLDIHDILPEHLEEDETKGEYLKNFVNGQPVPAQFEARLKHKDGTVFDVVMAMSNISVAGKDGSIIVAKDISQHKQVEDELGQQRQQYAQLTNAINIGVFRATTGRHSRLIQANPAALSILGIEATEDLSQVNLLDLFHDNADRKNFINELTDKGKIENKVVQLQKTDGSMPAVLLSVVQFKDKNGILRYYDGIVEDITEQKNIQKEQESLIAELQSSLLYLNEPISHFLSEPIFCDMNQSISNAAEMMAKRDYSALLLTAEAGDVVGIVTDHDLRERAVGKAIDVNSPACTIMSSPLLTISDSTLVFEAILMMQEHGVQHLAVKNNTGRVRSIVRNSDILLLHRYSSTFMFHEIHSASSVDKIVETHKRQPQLVKSLVESGAKSKSIMHIITAVSDSIVEKYIQFALDELGEPPVRFSFMALGSEGRQEQTLFTDQDNAIIYEDVSAEQNSSVQEYFLKLGGKVCDWLNETGYKYCNGEVMANNPKWCMPLAGWKEQFKEWIAEAAPQDFREFNIFFDFRSVFGEEGLAVELREHIFNLLNNNAPFFQHFALDALNYKPPIGMFGKIVLESSGDKPNTFDIKESMLPIVNFARLYALNNGVYETNTLDRLDKLYEKNIVKKADYDETVVSYNYLMQMRFKHQTQMLGQNSQPNNNINPKELTHIEETMLKQTFAQITNIQKRISFDFTGTG
ncbi:MAG: cache domain-containing protein [Phycisphaerae bacterium]|nr:cache domain-containing protein [Phycisphaerae bacterium]